MAAPETNYSTIPPTSSRGPSAHAYISFLNCYAAILVVILGVLGNSASILVLSALKVLRTSSTGMLLIVLAFSDNGALLIGLLPVWVKAVSGFSYYEDNRIMCKLRTALMYFSLHYSACILALIAIERFVSVYKPAVAKRRFSLKRAAIMVACLALVLFALNSQAFVTVTLVDVENEPKPWCYASARYEYFVYNIWVRIDFIMYAITWLIISACNIAIIVRVRQINRRVNSNNRRPTSVSAASRRSKLTSMTVMLLVVNTSFLLTTMPYALYVLFDVENLDTDVQDMLYESLYLLSYLNNAINFLLYVISGTKFRSAMLELVPARECIGSTNGSTNGVTNNGFALTHVNSVTNSA